MMRIVRISFWSSFPKTASRSRHRDGGARACAARGRPAAHTLAAPEAYAARDCSVRDFRFVDHVHARGDGVRSDQSRLGCLSSHIAD
jgi:hypothetical protein